MIASSNLSYKHHHHHHISSSGSSSSSSKHHHHHHHHHSSGSSSTSSSHRHHHHSSSGHHHHHHHHKHSNSGSSSHQYQKTKHHQYVNAIPSSSSSSSSCRYINQSDLCTQIISGSIMPKHSSSNTNTTDLQSNDQLSYSSSSSSNSSSSNSSSANSVAQPTTTNERANHNFHNHTSACCGIGASTSLCLVSQSDAHQRSTLGDNSMRCTLRRGRPNTPKTGLSVEYRIRKSSVPNTPEFKHAAMSKINYTISNDDIKVKPDFDRIKPAPIKTKSKSKTSVITSLSSTSLNTAMVHIDDEANLNKGEEECDDAQDALDIALIGDEDIEDENEAENINDQHINEDYNSNSNSSLLSG